MTDTFTTDQAGLSATVQELSSAIKTMKVRGEWKDLPEKKKKELNHQLRVAEKQLWRCHLCIYRDWVRKSGLPACGQHVEWWAEDDCVFRKGTVVEPAKPMDCIDDKELAIEHDGRRVLVPIEYLDDVPLGVVLEIRRRRNEKKEKVVDTVDSESESEPRTPSPAVLPPVVWERPKRRAPEQEEVAPSPKRQKTDLDGLMDMTEEWIYCMQDGAAVLVPAA